MTAVKVILLVANVVVILGNWQYRERPSNVVAMIFSSFALGGLVFS